MHTSWWIFAFFWVGVALGLAAQTCNYLSSGQDHPWLQWLSSFILPQRLRQWLRQRLRTCGFYLGISGTLIAGITAFVAAANWGALPMSTKDLRPGELWDDGGSVAVLESDERRATWERLTHPH
jgi:hypothetical protein